MAGIEEPASIVASASEITKVDPPGPVTIQSRSFFNVKAIFTSSFREAIARLSGFKWKAIFKGILKAIFSWHALEVSVVVVGTLIIASELRLTRETFNLAEVARNRPALQFSHDVKVERLKGERGRAVIRLQLEVQNHGSGTAYKVEWRQQDQVPTLHSGSKTKTETFATVEASREAFDHSSQYLASDQDTITRLILGAGLSQKLVFDFDVGFESERGEYNIKKYIAAFYESERSRKNASVIGVRIRFGSSGEPVATVEDVVIVSDPREPN